MAETRPLVLVTEPEYRKGEECFVSADDLDIRRVPSEEPELAAAIREARAKYVIVGPRQYTGALYDALPAGGLIARFGVGHDGIDKARATAAGLMCTNTPGVLDRSMAEYTMLLIAAAARRLPEAIATIAGGGWIMLPGADLHGKTLAVIGCGGIGRAVARIASGGYGMRVIGCTRQGVPVPAAIDQMARVTDDFADAVHGADFVSLHIPSRPDTHQFVNRERLSHLAKHAWLINTSRGAVVDEAALFDALSEGRIAGAALDVFAREPYVPQEGSGDLRSLRNVILTPHIGSATAEANRCMAERALQNVRLAVAGEVAKMELLVVRPEHRA